jgi:hypothetical protein
MNIYQSDYTQKPLIFELIKHHENAAAKKHLEAYPEEIRLKGWMDDTPLHVASSSGNLEMLHYLIEKGAEINAERSGVYATPLCWAENVEIAQTLLDYGATMHDLELFMATRLSKTEVADLLLSSGAKINPAEPQYLQAATTAIIQVYLDHGINISLPDKHGQTLLHHLAWMDLPEVFDFAYKNGCNWQKDGSNRTPYQLARQGKRQLMIEHIRTHYADLIAYRSTPIDVNDYAFEAVHFLRQSPTQPTVFIGMSGSTNLLRYELIDAELILVRVVHIDTPTIRNFTFNSYGNILLPTTENKVLVIEQITLQILYTMELPEQMPLDQLTYLPEKRIFIGSSDRWKIALLDEDLKIIHEKSAEDGTFLPKINPDESLIAFDSYDQETYFNLYSLTDGPEIHFIETFFKEWENTSSGFAFNGNEFAVSFPGELEYYAFQNGKPHKLWKIDISPYVSKHHLSYIACISADQLLVGKGKTLLFIDIHLQQIVREETLELASEIRELYTDRENKYLFVSTPSELKLLLLS